MNNNELKLKLLSTSIFCDNEWLDKYVNLIINNQLDDLYKLCYTDKHHIIPKHVFKYLNTDIDNSKDNLVLLSITDHILSHYYLSLCSNNFSIKYANLLAVFFTLGNNGKFVRISEDDLLKTLSNILDLIIERREMISLKFTGEGNPFYGKRHSEETKTKISIANTDPDLEKRLRLRLAQLNIDHTLQIECMRKANLERDYSGIGVKISRTKQINGTGNNHDNKIHIINKTSSVLLYIKPVDYDLYKLQGFLKYIPIEEQVHMFRLWKKDNNISGYSNIYIYKNHPYNSLDLLTELGIGCKILNRIVNDTLTIKSNKYLYLVGLIIKLDSLESIFTYYKQVIMLE